MITLALKGQPLMVPEKAGGSFLDHEDMTQALLLAIDKQESVGQIFNLATSLSGVERNRPNDHRGHRIILFTGSHPCRGVDRGAIFGRLLGVIDRQSPAAF